MFNPTETETEPQTPEPTTECWKELFERLKKYGTIFFLGALKKNILYVTCLMFLLNVFFPRRFILAFFFIWILLGFSHSSLLFPGVEKAPEGGRIGEVGPSHNHGSVENYPR